MGALESCHSVCIDRQRGPGPPLGDVCAPLCRWVDKVRSRLPILDGATQGGADDVGRIDSAVDEGLFLPFKGVHPNVDLARGRAATR
jgi:hypothetical protein